MENNNEYRNYNQQRSNGTTLVAIISVLAAIILGISIFATLIFTGVISVPGKSPDIERTMYVVENAYMRSEPKDTSTIMISLSPGAAVAYHKDANSLYAFVTYTNSEGIFDGYIEKSLLSFTKPSVADVTTMYVANVKHSIYFRSAPVEQESNIICEIPLGMAITFIENANNVFSKISYNGQEGYVKREYLSYVVPNTGVVYSGNDTVVGYRYVANVADSIYLRSQPAENASNIICTIPLGTQVGYIEYTDSTFSKIAYNGRVGYAKTQYLSSNRPSHYSSIMTVCNVKHSIYLRRAPEEVDSNIICEIPVGSQVEYLGNANGTFYKISWNGYTGYAKSQYLR